MSLTDTALANRLLALADDELVLAHRNSEWTGHAPILEEDIGLANLAQDELGHATLWYELRQPLTGQTPDQLVYFRHPEEWRNVQLTEWPRGDWAFTMLRQFLFDAYELALLTRLAESPHTGLAHTAAQIRREELYHLRHSGAWVRRLGLGTEESHRRMQAALTRLWPLSAQLFAPLPDEALLVQAGYFPPLAEVRQDWLARVTPALTAAELTPPTLGGTDLRRDQHSPHLTELLAELQSVARADPEAEW